MPRPKPTVLVVDRETRTSASLIRRLRQHGLVATWAREGEAAFNAIDARPPECVVTALKVPRIHGLAVLARALARRPDACVVVLAGLGEVDLAVAALRQGASDFQIRPLNLDRLLVVLDRGLSHQALAARAAELERRLDERLASDGLAGASAAIRRVMDQVRSVAATRTPVLIEGEPGAGKGLVAQAIHRLSPRRNDPFVAVDCAALAEGLIEHELFGHERPMKTGSPVASPGRVEIADGGTLFLDGVGAVPPSVQVKLLRVVQERVFERAFGAETLKADVRLIAATHQDLEAEVRAGRFREDLFHRLGARIAVPPLRERAEDLVPLIEGLVREFNRAHRRKVRGITLGALERLRRHSWPGNVRELRATIEAMVVTTQGPRPLGVSDLPDSLRGSGDASEALEVEVGMTADEAERQLIAATLEHQGLDRPRTAAMLGIGLRTLYRKIKQYGLR